MPSTKPPAGAIDVHRIRELADILNEAGLTEIEIDQGGARIRVAKAPAPIAAWSSTPAPSGAPAQPYPAPVLAAAQGDEAAGETIASPMVGTVYLQAQPGAEPFVKVGDVVAEGQTLLLVEAMKTMNPIAAPRAGRVIEFLVADAQPVEFGEPLMILG
jgi:acetyl-CoA carboxylase biotin carboxyl carrier protein